MNTTFQMFSYAAGSLSKGLLVRGVTLVVEITHPFYTRNGPFENSKALVCVSQNLSTSEVLLKE